MTFTHYPRTNTERDLVVRLLQSYLCDAAADPTLVALDKSLFLTEREAYIAARAAWGSYTATKRVTAEAAAVADAAFVRDLRIFTGSIRDTVGSVQARVVAELLGGKLASVVVKRSYPEEVQRAHWLLSRLPLRTDLSYDADCAEALTASTTALEAAMIADKAAGAAMEVAGAAQKEARESFDRAWRRLVRAAKAMVSEAVVTSAFPSFRRSNGSAATEDEESVSDGPVSETSLASTEGEATAAA